MEGPDCSFSLLWKSWLSFRRMFTFLQSCCGCTFARPLQGDDVAAPFTVGYIKGWRRSVTCLVVAEGIRSLGIPLGDLHHDYKAGQSSLRSYECDPLELLIVPPGIHENYFWNRGALWPCTWPSYGKPRRDWMKSEASWVWKHGMFFFVLFCSCDIVVCRHHNGFDFNQAFAELFQPAQANACAKSGWCCRGGNHCSFGSDMSIVKMIFHRS